MLIHRREDPSLAAAAQQALLSDERLSLIAIAVLMKILNHAPEWKINAKTFHALCEEARGPRAESQRGIRMAFRELEGAGYMRRTKGRQSNGDFHTWLEATDVPNDFNVVAHAVDHGVMPADGKNWIYIVGPAQSSVVKIGTAVDVPSRLNGIQTGHPLPLLVHWTCPGGGELEGHLHRKFNSIRMQGEWFDFGETDPVTEVRDAAERFYRLPRGSLNASPVGP